MVSSDADLAAAIRAAGCYAPGKTIVAARPDVVRSHVYVVDQAIPAGPGMHINAARLDYSLAKPTKQ